MLRNFWATVIADGGLPFATGSDDKGGIAFELLRRANGEMSTAVRVVGTREADCLLVDVIVDGDVVYHERTPLENGVKHGA